MISFLHVNLTCCNKINPIEIFQSALAYFYIEHELKLASEDGMPKVNIERMIKEFKTHWIAIDCDEKFLNYCFQKWGEGHTTEDSKEVAGQSHKNE